MGYELHIVRSEHWWGAESNPITREEWSAYAVANPLLVEDGWVDWSDIGREPIYSFTKNDGVVVGLSWSKGKVDISGPMGTVGELVAIADELKARLIGDEDESYTLADDED